jgi:hypothetical protein
MPQVTVTIATGADDDYWKKSGGTYPPTSNDGNFPNDTEFWVRKQFSAATYRTQVGFIRFNTGAALPDSATITNTILRIYTAGGINDTDNRSLDIEWYPWTTLSVSDYTDNVATTAYSIDITTLIAGVGGSGEIDLVLTNPNANISKTGYTGLRLGISGGAPTGENDVFIRTLEHATLPETQLIITYVAPESINMLSVGGRGAGW